MKWDTQIYKRLGQRTISCDYRVTDGYKCCHRHVGWEILFVLRGNGVFIANHTLTPMQSPALVMIESSIPHGNDIKGCYERWNTIILPGFPHSLDHLLDKNKGGSSIENTISPLKSPSGLLVAPVPPSYVNRLENIFCTLAEELQISDALSVEIAALKIMEIKCYFSRFMKDRTSSQTAAAITADNDALLNAQDTFANLLNIIEDHLDEELTADFLAKAVHLSRSQVYRLIRTRTGQSLNNYIKHRRIAKAKTLLKYSDLPITNIAALVGMPLSGFCKVFRQLEMLTPTEFRDHSRSEHEPKALDNLTFRKIADNRR